MCVRAGVPALRQQRATVHRALAVEAEVLTGVTAGLDLAIRTALHTHTGKQIWKKRFKD